MNKTLLLLTKKMLDMASDEFSNHGCNDLSKDVIEIASPDPNFLADYKKWYGSDDGYPESLDSIPDYGIMDYLVHKIDEELKIRENY